MTSTPSDRPGYLPDGYHSVTPYLTSPRASELVDFVKAAFGATERFRGTGSAGGLHAEVQLGDSRIMIGGGPPVAAGQEKLATLHYYVPDADATYEQALRAGATSLHAPIDQPYEDREAGVTDPFGNSWYVATHRPAGVAAAHYVPAGLHSVTPYLHIRGAVAFIEFLKKALDATEVLREAAPDGTIRHAKVRVGDSVLEVSEARPEYPPLPMMFYVYVPDTDASYRQALTAGATTLREPVDQDYGDRTAAVTDAFGNEWYVATPLRARAKA